jgi:glutamate racemase
VIDPAPAIARQTGRVLARQGLEAGPAAGHHVFYTSGDAAAFSTMIQRLVPCVGEGVPVRAARWREGDLAPV